jgi:hypothetical protein
VLSLGTTTDVPTRSRRLDRGGLTQWARTGVDVILRAQDISVTNHARLLLADDRVVRVDPLVPDGAFALDKVDADDLLGRAGDVSRKYAPRIAALFTDHVVPTYRPYYPPRKE